MGGHQDPLREVEVHRGEAQGGAADLLPVGDPVGEHVGVAQELHRPVHLPLGNEGSDIGGGDGDVLQLHLADDVTADPQLGAGLLEPLGISLAHVAEVEVVSRHHMDHAQLLHQVLSDKIPPVHAHHAVKAGDDDLLNAVAGAHEPRPVLHRAEQGDHLAGDGGGGAAVEGEGGCGGPQFLGFPHDGL